MGLSNFISNIIDSISNTIDSIFSTISHIPELLRPKTVFREKIVYGTSEFRDIDRDIVMDSWIDWIKDIES